eukprot:TRINITY_DN24738_c0_g1_i1.p1 TRINITY_DN24738_c0_g1~~TRINITY_DN24738_c0_g1_i1.p1  ORF type:complete len:314 (-),score=54.96 TRINITY_DN24738_c0_g1_i1:296-1237(-)
MVMQAWGPPSPDMHEIKPNLWLGSLRAAQNEEALLERGVTHVLSVGEYNLGARQRMRVPRSEGNEDSEEDVVQRERLLISLPDSSASRLDKHFDASSSFISEGLRQGGSVLVHCYAGQSRSLTLVVAYLMCEESLTAAEALEIVREKRPVVRPNAGFLSQLLALEGRLRVEGRLCEAASKASQPKVAWGEGGDLPAVVQADTAESDQRPEQKEEPELLVCADSVERPLDDAQKVGVYKTEEAQKKEEADAEAEQENPPVSPAASEDASFDPFGLQDSRLRRARLDVCSQRFRNLRTPPGILGLAAPLRRRRLS